MLNWIFPTTPMIWTNVKTTLAKHILSILSYIYTRNILNYEQLSSLFWHFLLLFVIAVQIKSVVPIHGCPSQFRPALFHLSRKLSNIVCPFIWAKYTTPIQIFLEIMLIQRCMQRNTYRASLKRVWLVNCSNIVLMLRCCWATRKIDLISLKFNLLWLF